MAIAYLSAISGGTRAEKTSSTTFTFSPGIGGTIPAGTLICIHFAYDNLSGSTPTVTSIDKHASETNSWTIFDAPASPTTGGGSAKGSFAWILTTVSWGSNFTFNPVLSGAVTAKTTIVSCFSGVGACLGTDGQAASGVNALGTASAGDLYIGHTYNEDNAAPASDTDTIDGSWISLATAVTSGGGAASNVASNAQYKIATGTNAQNLSHANVDGGVIVSHFTEASPGQAVADSENLTDSLAFDFVESNNDALGLTDSVNPVPDQSPTDALGLTDSLTAALSIVRTQTDNEDLTDAAASVLDKTVAQTDSEGLTDAVSTPLTIDRSVSESENLTDVVAISRSLTQNDSEGLADTVTTAGNVTMSVAETEGLTDLVVTTLDAARLISDTESLSDPVTPALVMSRSVADSSDLTDSVDASSTYTNRSIWRVEFNKRIGV